MCFCGTKPEGIRVLLLRLTGDQRPVGPAGVPLSTLAVEALSAGFSVYFPDGRQQVQLLYQLLDAGGAGAWVAHVS